MALRNLSFDRPRVILTIGDDGVVVTPNHIDGAEPFFVPGSARLGGQEIIDFIDRHPRARLTLFIDNLAQDYRCDTLPRLNVIDRAKLARRRLRLHFPAARLTASLRLKTGGKTLMIGLHESNPVFLWAERLRARMPDIALLPIEGVRIVTKLMPEAAQGWAMLVSRHTSGGFRQIVTFRGDLVFTRLTPLPDIVGGDSETIARDIKASLDYLVRHGLRETRELAVLLLMPDDIHQDKAFKNLPIGSIDSLSPHRAAQELALPFAPHENDNAGDLLFAAGLLSSPCRCLSLMLPDTRRSWRARRVASWGLRVASVALIAALSLTAWRAGDLATTFFRAQETALRLEKNQRELAQEKAAAAPVTEPLGRLRQAVERLRIYAEPTPTPWQGIGELAAGTGDGARIVRLEWKKDGDDAPDILTVGLRAAAPAAAVDPDQPQQPKDATHNDRADSVAAFTRAAQNIARAMPDYTIATTEPPYPALPQDSVSAETQGRQDDPTGTITLQRRAP